MSWARLDDGWHDHPKVVAAGLDGAGLWTMCLTWAHKARRTSPTPGVVPEAVVARFAGAKAKKLSARLHEVGLWDAKTDAGWPIHDFDEYLPRYDPEQAKEAGAKGGKARAAKQTAKQTASEPLTESVGEPLNGFQADQVADSSTRGHDRVYAQEPRTRSRTHLGSPGLPDVTTVRASDHGKPGDVVAAWAEGYRTTGVEPSDRQCTNVATIAKPLLADNTIHDVTAAARRAGAKGFESVDRELAMMRAQGGKAQTWHDDKSNPRPEDVPPPQYDPVRDALEAKLAGRS